MRRRKSRPGTKSASNTAMNSPREQRRPSASAPALNPARRARWSTRMSTPRAAARPDAGLVGRVVEHLDLETVARVLEIRDGGDQTLHHATLVVDRKLDRD